MQRDLVLLMMLTAAAAPASAQQMAPVAAHADSAVTQNAASVPDFSGVWHRWSRPGPVTNRSRIGGVSNYNQLVGNYTNPILNPRAAQVVKEHGELSLRGVG